MAGASTLSFTESNFEAEVLKSPLPVLVDFGAEWCGPCRMLAPIIDQVAADYAGRVKVGAVDTGADPNLAVRYGIMGIPVVFLFKNGEPIQRFEGARPKSFYTQWLDGVLGVNSEPDAAPETGAAPPTPR